MWWFRVSIPLVLLALWIFFHAPAMADNELWHIRSIDTTKFSRDRARQHVSQEEINTMVAKIASTGANYVAIDTPYDEEFIPVLTQWVSAARKYHLHVWFRGNFSGWEGWFGYPKTLTRKEHLTKLSFFLEKHQNLFQNGDIFVSCPECENGGPGDPRNTGDVGGFRKFLIAEYRLTNNIFAKNNKHIITNYYSMNGDVARLVMNKPTTKALGGIVTLDHYVPTPQQLAADIAAIAKKSGGKIVIGEIGAPIPDIHGNLSENGQADWIQRAFAKLSESPSVIAVNYWVGFEGSTKLWNTNGTPRKAVGIVTDYYTPKIVQGKVLDQFGNGVDATVTYLHKTLLTGTNGTFQIPVGFADTLTITGNGFHKVHMSVNRQKIAMVVHVKAYSGFFDKVRSMFCFIILCKK